MKARALLLAVLFALAGTSRLIAQDIEPTRVIVSSGYIPNYEPAEPRPTPHIYVVKAPVKKKVAKPRASKAKPSG